MGAGEVKALEQGGPPSASSCPYTPMLAFEHICSHTHVHTYAQCTHMGVCSHTHEYIFVHSLVYALLLLFVLVHTSIFIHVDFPAHALAYILRQIISAEISVS